MTGYDERHQVTNLRLLDAETNGADWKEVARIVLHLDPGREPDRARRAWKPHLARAHWMTEHGYRHLLRGGAPH
ncbi:DNA -binding domain-containing protein [Bradyrhizobium sp. AUGA SZCCT0182]|uniref:DNA -binding domain-containing protein n=1 Tax=Bradyrhizobium sp. AUGA SZCCT0182 TaxID=2807667 RepID=UPI002012D740